MNKQYLFEILRLDPHKIPREVDFWALYATSFYEKLFKQIDDPNEIEATYKRMLKNPKIKGRTRDALEFFYLLRLDELENPDFWNLVGGKKLKENMKLVKENLDDYIKKESLNEVNRGEDEWANSELDKWKEVKTKEIDPLVRQLVRQITSLEDIIWEAGNRYQQIEWMDFIEDLANFRTIIWTDLDEYDLQKALIKAQNIVNKISRSS